MNQYLYYRNLRLPLGMRNLLVLIMIGMGSAQMCLAQTNNKAPTESDIKVVCIYNLLKYTDYDEENSDKEDKNVPPANPDEKEKSSDLLIGIIGKDHFGEAWDRIRGKKVGGQTITIKKFDTYPADNDAEKTKALAKELRKCKGLFIFESKKDKFKNIIAAVKHESVLTISESENFLEQGGIVNFVIGDKKVQFEINLDAAREAQLKIKAQVLKLAQRVIQTKKK